jgi:uncharacterized NAD(P)/FAD-binding protein YdhS
MTNETFEPVGLLEIRKQIKANRKSVDDLEERLHSALDAKRDVASNYVEQLDEIEEKEVEVKLDPITDLIQTTVKSNDAVYLAGFEAGYEKGFWKGYNKIHAIASSEQRDRELLESHGIDIEPLFENVQKIIADHEQDIDEDEPDQYPPEKWGGTK